MPRIITRFDNLSAADLADRIGELDGEAKALEVALKALKAELATRKVERAEGARFVVTRSDTVRWTIDSAAVRKELGEAWANAHSKVTPVTSFRVAMNPAAVMAHAA